MPNKRRILVLLVLACLAVAGASVQTYRFDQRIDAARAAEDAIARQLFATDLALADARLAQAGYVAIGQGPDFWMKRFDEVLTRVEGTLRERQQTTQSAGALSHYDAAIEQLKTLRASDRRARNYVGNGQFLMASDVVFVESLEIIGQIAANVGAARDTEVFEAGQVTTLNTRYRQAMTGAGVLFVLLVAVLAFRNIPLFPLELGAASVTRATPTAEPAAVVSPCLTDAADVCVDMARLLDGRDLPALLGRAAAAIGATGLVLWVADEDRTTLRATLGHGYSERTLQRLGTLQVSADNVTSLACRTLQPQVVTSAAADKAGAVAVPLIGASGCVGVLAAEVTGVSTGSDAVAVARVIAAQLAAVIAPTPRSSSHVAGLE